MQDLSVSEESQSTPGAARIPGQIDGQEAFAEVPQEIVHKSSGLAWFIFTFNPEEFLSDILTLFSHVLLELTCKASFQYVWDPELSFSLKAAFLTLSHFPLVDFPFKIIQYLRKILEGTMCCFPFSVKWRDLKHLVHDINIGK